MSMNLVTLLYLVASVCFIQALKGLSHPTTSIRGNIFGMTGMAIAVLTTAALIVELSGGKAQGMVWVLGGLVVGGAIGAIMANRVEMTKMPELVAFMHSMIGLAAVCIAVAVVAEPWAFGIVAEGAPIPGGNRIELALGAFIGAVTFSGSVIVDLAVEQGGNCPLSEAGETVVKHGVTLVGETNLPARVGADASALYARNVFDFLKLIVAKDGTLTIDLEDDIVKACLMCRDGQLLRA